MASCQYTSHDTVDSENATPRNPLSIFHGSSESISSQQLAEPRRHSPAVQPDPFRPTQFIPDTSGIAGCNFYIKTLPCPSECETIPPGVFLSDSGYGSLPKATLETESLYGGDVDRKSQAGGVGRFTCPTCHKTVKSKAELK
ncbi:hypothetical protein GQ53DRAFT_743920 [Thozetella sp. PMI_491]|nr:hypothetical protein GQ53DRAFT_743920 [Thozetella sp. PMI_491]